MRKQAQRLNNGWRCTPPPRWFLLPAAGARDKEVAGEADTLFTAAIQFVDVSTRECDCQYELAKDTVVVRLKATGAPAADVRLLPVATDPAAGAGAPVAVRRKLLLRQIECLQVVEETEACITGRLPCALALAIQDAAKSKRLHSCVQLIKYRLYYRQFRCAVLLLRVFRRLLPDLMQQSGLGETDHDALQLLMKDVVETKPPPLYRPPANTDTALDTIGDILVKAHGDYYEQLEEAQADELCAAPDLRDILIQNKRDFTHYVCWCLHGVDIVFSGVIPQGSNPHRNARWREAKQMGAQCSVDISDETTHVVAKMKHTAKCSAGSKMPGVYVVRVEWLIDCARQGRRVDETPYLHYPHIAKEVGQQVFENPSLLADLDAEMDAELDDSDDDDAEDNVEGGAEDAAGGAGAPVDAEDAEALEAAGLPGRGGAQAKATSKAKANLESSGLSDSDSSDSDEDEDDGDDEFSRRLSRAMRQQEGGFGVDGDGEDGEDGEDDRLGQEGHWRNGDALGSSWRDGDDGDDGDGDDGDGGNNSDEYSGGY